MIVVSLLVTVLALVPALSRAHDRLSTDHVTFSFGKNIERPHEKVSPASLAVVVEAPRPPATSADVIEPLRIAPDCTIVVAAAPLRAPPAI